MKKSYFIKIVFAAATLILTNLVTSAQNAQSHSYEAFIIADDTYMLFRLIEPGTYIMGSQNKDIQATDGPQHKVTITQSFYIGVYEVTQQQWNKVMKNLTWNNPSRFGGNLSHPVENISWRQANEFLDRINKYNNDSSFRLPTEAEWEYACRAGTETKKYWGDDREDKLSEWFAWLGGSPYGMTHPVGQLVPNAWGLYDMCGNVVEFTMDRYAPYKPEDQIDPLNQEGKQVVARGGDWFHASGGDSETRRTYNEEGPLSFLGFRVVRIAESK